MKKVMRPTFRPEVDMDSELSFSRATPGNSHRRRKSNTKSGRICSKAFMITTQLILLLFKTCSAGAEEDWAKLCTSKCKCTRAGWTERADCQGANFHNIPSGLSPELQVLDLSFNWISQLSQNEFERAGLVKLRKVFLSSSKIERIDRDAFRSLKVMVELDLTGNELQSIHMDAFKFNEKLGKLRLNSNPLTKLHGVQFPPLLRLKLLDLSNCQLSQLKNNTFDKLSNLEQLNLTGNNFQHISEQVFTSLIKLKSLSLQKNPWKCDCRLRSFRDWIMAQEFYRPFTCTQPGRLQNVQWSVLQSIDFACKPEIAGLQIGGQATQALFVYADVGSGISLECLVCADPAPEVKWIRDGRVLANSSSRSHGRVYLLDISGGEYKRSVNLTILKSNLDDAGVYLCVGSNAGGVVEKNITLNFQNAPPPIGMGVGPGFLGGKHGAYNDQSWLMIIIGALCSLVIITIVGIALCFCTFKLTVN